MSHPSRAAGTSIYIHHIPTLGLTSSCFHIELERSVSHNTYTEQVPSVFQALHWNVPLGRHPTWNHSNYTDAAVLGNNQAVAPRRHFFRYINTKIQHGFPKYSIVITNRAFKKVANTQS